jgi:SPP1 gp7 family putative phage head morphogenesis protein
VVTTGTGPERDHGGGGGPSSGEDEVERMAHVIAGDVARLEKRTIDKVLPALLEARAELQAGLAEWLQKADGNATFTAQDLRRGLASIDAALEQIGQMRPDLQTQLLAAMHEGGSMAAGHLREELARFGSKFGESIRPTQIATAAIVARAKHEIIPRIRTSSARYVQSVREDMRHQLAIGLARGETFHQMTNRLRRLGGPRGLVALRGVAGEPGSYVEDIAEGLFNRYRGWAERVVRTEVINAYNVEHVEGIKELNEDLRADGDQPLYLKWDASPDKRICELCRSLDGKITRVGKDFTAGIKQPPAHPNCRCVAVAWHPSWGGIEGELAPTGTAPGVKMPTPAETKRSKKIVSEEERQQKEALKEIAAEKQRPMATTYHPNMTDPNSVASPANKQRFEDSLEHVLGRRVPLEEISHGYAVPDGFEARLHDLHARGNQPTVEWKLYEKSTNKFAGTLIRDFGKERGKPYVHHAYFKLEKAFQGSGLSDHVNGNALRRYEKWGVKHVDVNAAWVGRYAWARLGYQFKYPDQILRSFDRYLAKQPSLAHRKTELTTIVRELVKNPTKLAAWDLEGQQFPDEFNKGGKTAQFGKAFLLSDDVGMWDGYIDVNRKNPGYLTAIRKAHVVPRK